MKGLFIRLAFPSEKLELEQLQMRASLENEGDRDALLAHPDSIELPAEQIAGGRVFVSEWKGTIVGFAAIEPREDGDSELDGLFVEPACNVGESDSPCLSIALKLPENEGRRLFALWEIHTRRGFMQHVDSR